MKYLSGSTNGDWLCLSEDDCDADGLEDDESAPIDFEGNTRKVRTALKEMLTAEHLVALSGSGTSFCVEDADGVRLAPMMSDLWSAVQEATGDDFDSTCELVGYEDGEDIELLLSRCQMYLRLHDDEAVSSFVFEAESTIADRCRFVGPDVLLPTHESFLRKAAHRSPRLQLFTTNYDLCFEFAASRLRFVAIDGFSHTVPQEFDAIHFGYDIVHRDSTHTDAPDYISSVFHLYKLHGSVDWEEQGGRILRRQDTDAPLLIYPRESKFKLSYNQPFLEHMARFQTALRKRNVALVVAGFGFNDNHIVQPILTALRTNVHLRLIVVSLGLKDSENEAIAEIRSFAEKGDQRVGMLSGTFEELVDVMPQLVATTEEEAHFERIRTMRELS